VGAGDGSAAVARQPPGRRLGPRPLALHLAQAHAAAAGGSLALDDVLAGLQAYWRHPYRRTPAEPPALWSCGTTRLLDYGPAGAFPVLAVPSLINRAYILDLLPGRSLLRQLRAEGFRPLLLDWGVPGAAERRLTLADFVLARLGAAVDWWGQWHGGRPAVLGYCMGGLLAVALAVHRREALAGLALLATPWDFHARAGTGSGERAAPPPFAPLSALAGGLGGLPVAVIQGLFAGVDPLQVPRKFARFAKLDPASPEGELFVAVEDWLNDGVPLAPEVARECLLDWYGANLPGRGRWRLAGHLIQPERLGLPCFVAIPERDRIVPPSSAEALAECLPAATVVRPAGGHIGMVVSARAQRSLWRPLSDWLRRVAALQNWPWRRPSGRPI
jgi:polyhydroxyalkanoate synthase